MKLEGGSGESIAVGKSPRSTPPAVVERMIASPLQLGAADLEVRRMLVREVPEEDPRVSVPEVEIADLPAGGTSCALRAARADPGRRTAWFRGRRSGRVCRSARESAGGSIRAGPAPRRRSPSRDTGSCSAGSSSRTRPVRRCRGRGCRVRSAAAPSRSRWGRRAASVATRSNVGVSPDGPPAGPSSPRASRPAANAAAKNAGSSSGPRPMCESGRPAPASSQPSPSSPTLTSPSTRSSTDLV